MTEKALTVDEAMDRLVVIPGYDPGGGPGSCVHTFVVAGMVIGAHWRLDEVREAFETHGVREAHSPMMSSHGIVVTDEAKGRRVYFESKEPS